MHKTHINVGLEFTNFFITASFINYTAVSSICPLLKLRNLICLSTCITESILRIINATKIKENNNSNFNIEQIFVFMFYCGFLHQNFKVTKKEPLTCSAHSNGFLETCTLCITASFTSSLGLNATIA